MLLVRGQGELWVQPGCQQLSRSKIKTPLSRWGFLQLGGLFLPLASLLFVCLALLYLCINGDLVTLAPVLGGLGTSCRPRLQQQQQALELPWGHLVSGLTAKSSLGSQLALQMSPDPAGAGGCRKTPLRSFWSPNGAETPNTRGTPSPRWGCHLHPGALLQPQGLLPASLGGTREPRPG